MQLSPKATILYHYYVTCESRYDVSIDNNVKHLMGNDGYCVAIFKILYVSIIYRIQIISTANTKAKFVTIDT